MYARASTGTVLGVEAYPVEVEVNRDKGLPQANVIGLARGAAGEAWVRVRSALKASGFVLSKANAVVNLLPAELPKQGSALDLAVAVAQLAADGQLPPGSLAGRRFYGELSLSGRLEPVRGAVLIADLARRAGELEVIVPSANAVEASIIPGIGVRGAFSLGEVVAHLLGREELPQGVPLPPAEPRGVGCFSEVSGQASAKRALELAAAGGHNLLMVGPPGSGKTMLARRLPGILPPLTEEESVEVTRIYSAAGLLRPDEGLVCHRPFRAPHHTASEAAVCGGGSTPRPGEITLAHRGVLFLDELPEFSRRALESLREPLEEGAIHVARAAGCLRFPARLLLVAAMNPCPCGHFGAPATGVASRRICLCSAEQVQRYRTRISGPLLDRIDMHLTVSPVPWRDQREAGSEASAQIALRVRAARERQARRLGVGRTNASMVEAEIRARVRLTAEISELLERATAQFNLSNRAVSRALKVACTVADLAGEAPPGLAAVEEALALRLSELEGGQAAVAA